MAFVHIGHTNYVNAEHIVSASCFRSKPIQLAIRAAKRAHRLVDLTRGGITRGVLFMTDGSLVLVSVTPATVARWAALAAGGEEEAGS